MTASVPTSRKDELPEKTGFLRLTRGKDGFDWRKLVRRAGPLGLPLILHILDCTDSAWGSPKSAHIPCEQFKMLTGRTSRAITGELNRLERVGLISRDEMDPWCFTPHMEAFDKAPLLMPEHRPTKAEREQRAERAREASVMAVSQVAALRSTITSPPNQPQKAPTEIHFRLNDLAQSEIHFRPTEIQSRVAETYCPWNWTCPHLCNEIGADKPLKPLKPEDTPAERLPALIEKSPSAGGRASPILVEERPTQHPPARPQEVIRENAPKPEAAPWHTDLRAFLETLPIKTDLDEPMFRQIATTLCAELLKQFKEVAAGATGIRKWAGYLGIARQVARRGMVKAEAAAATAGGESYGERRARELLEQRAKGKPNGGIGL